MSSDGEPTRLLEQWRDVWTVVVVDAATGGADPPGSVRTVVLRPGDLAPLAAAHGTSSHGFGPADAWALAAVLGAAPDRLVVHAIGIASTTHGTGLSPAVRRAAVEVAERVLAELGAAGLSCPAGPSSRRSCRTASGR